MRTTVETVAHHQPRLKPPASLSRRSKARRVVVGFALLFIVSQLLFSLLSAARPEMRDPYFYDKFDALRQLWDEKHPSRTIVTLGSSRTFYGLDALDVERQLESSHGEPVVVYNFGQFGAGPRLNSIYLHRLVALGCRPDVVLLEVLPPLLALRAQDGYEHAFVAPRRFHFDELDRAERYGWPRSELDGEWRSSILVPAYFLRLPIVGRAAPWMLPPGAREDGCRQTDERGSSWIDDARATAAARSEGIARARAEYAPILSGDFHISETARRALADSIELCQRDGIRIVLYLPPEAPSFRALYSAKARDEIDALLRELTRNGAVSILDGRDWLDEDDFIDGHHPLRRGGRKCSQRLVESGRLAP